MDQPNTTEHCFTGLAILITTLLALAGLYALPHAQAAQRLAALAYLYVWFAAFHGRHEFGLVWRTILVFAVYQIAVIILSMMFLIGGSLLGWIDWALFVAGNLG